jgi:hypothetical protein
MYLLADNPWGDFPTWVQAGCAMITLMLVIMGLLQNRRIQELVDIVKELSNQTAELKSQTAVLNDRYELELLLSAKSRMPFFEMKAFTQSERHSYALYLRNSGIHASNLSILDLTWDKTFITLVSVPAPSNGYVRQEGEIGFTVICNQILVQRELISFSFSLVFDDVHGNRFSQSVICGKGKITISSPKSIEQQAK